MVMSISVALDDVSSQRLPSQAITARDFAFLLGGLLEPAS